MYGTISQLNETRSRRGETSQNLSALAPHNATNVNPIRSREKSLIRQDVSDVIKTAYPRTQDGNSPEKCAFCSEDPIILPISKVVHHSSWYQCTVKTTTQKKR